ncbi:hypothetical protein [Rubripirellula obstinata]|nr:hypothetical protein [Rubripirellula obstinata]
MSNSTRVLLGVVTLAFVGCGGGSSLPQHAGVVFAHVGSADSATGTSHVLTDDGQFFAGFHYGDPQATDWNATIDWRFLKANDAADSYRLKWTFTPSSGATATGSSDVAFDGLASVVVSVNDQLTITIDPLRPQNGG